MPSKSAFKDRDLGEGLQSGVPVYVHPPSELARFQRLAALVVVGTALAWAWYFRGDALVWIWGGLIAWVLGYALFMAFEWVLVALVHGRDPTPAPTLGQSLQAWWAECHLAPRVFLFRQPFLWRRWPDCQASAGNGREEEGGPHQAEGNHLAARPVVFIHGFVCNRGLWLPWMKRMTEERLPYVSVNLEPVFGEIGDYVALIDDAVGRAERLGLGKPVLVCHSMGGLAARAWMASSGQHAARIDRVVTIGSPHHGTWLGQFGVSTNGQQMRRDSTWLSELTEREYALRGPTPYEQFVCWHSNTDNIVFPASTATLPGADNRLLCGKAHVAMCFETLVVQETLNLVRPLPGT